MKKILAVYKNKFELKALGEICKEKYSSCMFIPLEIKMSSTYKIHKNIIVALFYKIKEIFIYSRKIIEVESEYIIFITSNPAIRIASLIGKKRMIMYFRNIHFSMKDQSISDKLSSSVIGRLFPRIFNSQYSDYYLLSHDVNLDYLFNRVSSSIEYCIIGWYPLIMNNVAERERRIYFISASFEHHGMRYSDDMQIKYANEIFKYCVEKKINLIVRVHPNDSKDKYKFCRTDDSGPEIFLENIIPGDILITTLSSLLYEVKKGVNIIIYSNKELDILFEDFYKNNNIDPVRNVESILKLIENV